MMQPLCFRPLAIPDVMLVTPKQITDARGYFMEVWHAGEYARLGLNAGFVQVNQSSSRAATLRGLHYQVQRPQGKLVRVVSGEIYDVAVDLRRGSRDFGKWVAARLAGDTREMMWVPPGFAHGFYVTGPHAEVEYFCTDVYVPELDRTLAWNDPDVAVAWPLAADTQPIVSEKDARGALLRDAECYP